MASKPQKLPEQSTRYRAVQQPPPLQTRILIKRMLAEQSMTYTEIQKELEYHKIQLQGGDLQNHLTTLLRRQQIVRYRTPTCYKYAIK